MSEFGSEPKNKFGRRKLIKSAVLAGGAGLMIQGASNAFGQRKDRDKDKKNDDRINSNNEDDKKRDKARAPSATPFVEPLPVYGPKQPVNALYPAPTLKASPGEAGRDDHQDFLTHPPKQFYELRATEVMHSFHRELPPQKVWGFDGLHPGPTFVAHYGTPILVRMYNDLPANSAGFGSPEISIHLHNAHTPSESDGFAGDYCSQTKYGPTLARAGQYKDHHYPNCYAGHDKYPATDGDPREAIGTLWYHDHREHFTAPNVYRGLHGFFLLFDEIDTGNENDPDPKALRLPSGVGQYDIPLVFRDLSFDSSGYLHFDQFETDGVLGDKFSVNGKIQPFHSVARRKYRFRLLNGSIARFYEFFLVHERDGDDIDKYFTFIANDGNLLPAPLRMQSVRIAPAERADIVIDFSEYNIGDKVYLVNRLKQDDGRGPDGLESKGTQILRFDIDRDAIDNSRVPAKLRTLPPVNFSEVVKHRHWKFDRENGFWTVNNQVFDIEKPAAIVKLGTAEIWTLETSGGWHHPVHIHLEEFRILSRNGKPPPPHEQGRKDVVVLNPGEEVRVFIRFRDFVGKYLMHCHNTTHEDHGMMVRFDVVR